jgi:GNAT superfamily N-acetyltransferase
MGTPQIELKVLAPSDWPVVERLFGPRGVTGGCWCMWWRRRGGKTWDACKGEQNRLAFRALVQDGKAHGIIAFAAGEPVGWCNFGPREDFPRLVMSRVLQRPTAARRWSVACFFVRSGWRRRGIAQLLLERAVAESFRRGAEEVEGYPKTYPSAPSAPAAFVWTALPRMFEAAGFVPVKAEDSERVIYVRKRDGTLRSRRHHPLRPSS